MQALADRSPVNVPSEAAQAAQEAAARINRQLGLNSADPTAMQQQKPGPHAGLGIVTTENYPIPELMVKLIVGKRGEQITRLEDDSGCKVQIAPNGWGLPLRSCFLTGSPNSVRVCKQMLRQIIRRFSRLHLDGMDCIRWPEGNIVVDISIPGSKVGLIIGKGGENIRQLQERANVKMVIILARDAPADMDKPLRITGEPSKCQLAVEMVLELLAEKDMQGPGGGGMGTFNNFDGMYGGRDGPGDMEMGGPDFPSQFGGGREFNVQGDGGGGGFGMGRGGFGDPNFQDQTQYLVPVDECGLVIGKDAADKQAQDENAAAMAAYYPQYYANYGQYGQCAELQQPQQDLQLQQPGLVTLIPIAFVSPVIDLQTGQPDYVATWAEYCRQQGMYHQANAAAAVAGQPQQQPFFVT